MGPLDQTWSLVITAPGAAERSVPLGSERVVIGRARDCAVRIDDPEVSRQHLEVVREGAWLVARDLGSTTGTLLNGTSLEGTRALAPGDRLTVGPASVRVVIGSGPAPQTNETPSVLSGDVERDRRNVEGLLGAIRELHEIDDPDELLRRIVDRAIALAAGARGALLLRRGDGPLEGAIARDASGQDLPSDELLTRTIPLRALEQGRAILLTDAAEPDQRAGASPSIVSGLLRTVLAVPLPSSSGPLGVLYVDSRRPAEGFGASELAFFEALAAQGALAVERARATREREARERAARAKLESENARLRERLGGTDPLGESPAVRAALDLARRVAGSELGVLLRGETGTGKGVLAAQLHRLSPRREGPLVVVDCGAIPEALVESELFGHEKGAFTGASEARRGRFREADGGTLLLDEIGELPLALQPKLLRVLQERTVQPLGSQGTVAVDVRVIAATHRDLAALVEEGKFRRDLFYRLAAVTIDLPPLRERGDDTELLARAFLARYALATGRPVTGFTREALAAIRAHAWPGNVRELEHAVHRAVVLAEPPWVACRDLGLAVAPSAAEAERERKAEPFEGSLAFPSLQDARAAATERFERAYVADALKRAEGNVSHAAKLAGVSRQLLQRLMKRHGIERG